MLEIFFCNCALNQTLPRRLTQQCVIEGFNRISCNSEADASELLENHEEMFPCLRF